MKSATISSVMTSMIKYFSEDVIRINHALKVYSFAKSIGEAEALDSDTLQIIEIAAILHDIGIHESLRKYSSSAGNYQEIEGPPIARELLKEFNLKSEIVDRICYIIGNHHTYSRIDGIDFQILVESDFLVNIFEDNITGENINTIENKYFKTDTGLLYLKSMYKNLNTIE